METTIIPDPNVHMNIVPFPENENNIPYLPIQVLSAKRIAARFLIEVHYWTYPKQESILEAWWKEKKLYIVNYSKACIEEETTTHAIMIKILECKNAICEIDLNSLSAATAVTVYLRDSAEPLLCAIPEEESINGEVCENNRRASSKKQHSQGVGAQVRDPVFINGHPLFPLTQPEIFKDHLLGELKKPSQTPNTITTSQK